MRRLTFFLLTIGLLLSNALSAAAQDQAPPNPQGPVYIVEEGDTLFMIAIRFGISLDDLLKANAEINPNLLAPGMEVVIPGLEGVQGRLVTETIQLGESMRSLSIRHQIPTAQIARLNRLTGPMEVFAGASLVLPDQGEAARPVSRYPVEDGVSLLQYAASSGQNPWLLTEINQMQGTWDLLPGETLFTPPPTPESETSAGAETLSLVSPLLKSVEVTPLPLAQGFTAVVKVSAPQPVELSGSLAGSPLRFFPNGENQWVALQGIHAMAAPGIHPFILSGKLPDNRSFAFEQMVVVQAAGYTREDINGVDPSTIDPVVTQPENDQVSAIVAPATPTKYWDGPFLSPGYDPNWITSWFGTRRSYNASPYSFFHTGVDYGGGVGLEIKAPAPGVIVFAGPLTVRGNATIIDHGWGVYSGFWHQSEIKVAVGDHVQTGQVIGLVGGTGRVTGAHLHWEVWVNGVQVNPLTWLEQTYP